MTDETPRHEAVRRLGGARHWGTYRSWRWLPGHKLNKLSTPQHGDTATIRGITHRFVERPIPARPSFEAGGTAPSGRSMRGSWVQEAGAGLSKVS